MTDLEKLARDICWAGFHYPPKGGKIKYWRSITANARASYIKTAEEFTWIATKLGRQKVIDSVLHRVPPASHTENVDERDRPQPNPEGPIASHSGTHRTSGGGEKVYLR